MYRIIVGKITFVKREKKGRSTGFEPATFGTTIQRSNQLSYDRHGKKLSIKVEELVFLVKHKVILYIG